MNSLGTLLKPSIDATQWTTTENTAVSRLASFGFDSTGLNARWFTSNGHNSEQIRCGSGGGTLDTNASTCPHSGSENTELPETEA